MAKRKRSRRFRGLENRELALKRLIDASDMAEAGLYDSAIYQLAKGAALMGADKLGGLDAKVKEAAKSIIKKCSR